LLKVYLRWLSESEQRVVMAVKYLESIVAFFSM